MAPSVDVVAAAEAALGARLPDARAERAAGGYSWITYVVRSGAEPVAVVRVAPEGGTLDPYDPAAERDALEAARGSVPAPKVLLVEADRRRFGAPLQVQTVGNGEHVAARSVDAADRPAYRAALAGALGSLHRDGDPTVLSDVSTTAEAVRKTIDEEIAHYRRARSARHPGFEIGLRWLLTNLPGGSESPVLCHGDFRLNNTLWAGPGRLGAVLDWERARAGDPMSDIAFTRQFSGWAAIEGDAVAEYETASGRQVREGDMTFFLRFERWRSYTSAIRGLSALVDRRRHEAMLAFIGEAGQAGMWEMVNWISDDLQPLPAALADEEASYVEPISPGRRREVASDLDEADPGREHLLDTEADRDALHRSVALLRTVEGLPDLTRALRESDPEMAWRAAYGVLTRRAGDEGRRLHPALQALGYRFSGRPTFLPEMRWR